MTRTDADRKFDLESGRELERRDAEIDHLCAERDDLRARLDEALQQLGITSAKFCQASAERDALRAALKCAEIALARDSDIDGAMRCILSAPGASEQTATDGQSENGK